MKLKCSYGNRKGVRHAPSQTAQNFIRGRNGKQKNLRYGHLLCLKRKLSDSYPQTAIWECLCDCGQRIEVPERLLQCGIVTSCGCRKGRAINLTGRRFGKLYVIEPLEARGKGGSVQWLCRCDCGNDVIVNANMLMRGRTQSCGCYGHEMRGSGRSFVAGTCIEIISSSKTPKNNTSGCKEISWNQGAWIAYINYAGKHYHLGRYQRYQDAVAVRKNVEILRLKYAKKQAATKENSPDTRTLEFSELLKIVISSMQLDAGK